MSVKTCMFFFLLFLNALTIGLLYTLKERNDERKKKKVKKYNNYIYLF